MKMASSSPRSVNLELPVLIFGHLFLGAWMGILVVFPFHTRPGDFQLPLWEWESLLKWFSIGLGVGLVLGFIQNHPRRNLGIIPLSVSSLAILFLVQFGIPEPGIVFAMFTGLSTGFFTKALIFSLFHQGGWAGLAAGVLATLSPCGLVCVFFKAASNQNPPVWEYLSWLFFACTILLALFFSWFFFREILELVLEILLWPIYRMKGYGPGLKSFPLRGPVIVIGNHSAWLDPMFLAKVLPRRFFPMMTSVFFDLPVIHWLMVHVAQAIRVEDSGFRRKVPELKDAIAVLDRGDALIIFPERGMRRKEEQPLKMFGQGIWHILKEIPTVPVVACWIEGGWGSFFSYFQGPPTKNKCIDFWRPIRIAVSSPKVIDPHLLAEHRALRIYLMKEVLEARKHLGLEPYPLPGNNADV